MNQLYISTCPETGRRFLCEIGQDNNIAEIFERDEKIQGLIDAFEFCKAFSDLYKEVGDFSDEAFLRRLANKARSIVSEVESL